MVALLLIGEKFLSKLVELLIVLFVREGIKRGKNTDLEIFAECEIFLRAVDSRRTSQTNAGSQETLRDRRAYCENFESKKTLRANRFCVRVFFWSDGDCPRLPNASFRAAQEHI